MHSEQLLQVLDLLPSPLITVVRESIESANKQAGRLLQKPRGKLTGQHFASLFVDDEEKIHEFIRAAARSTTPHISILQAKLGDHPLDLRCEASLLSPPEGDQPSRLIIHLVPREKSVESFVALNEKLHDLNREVERRKLLEESLRQHVKLVSLARDIGFALSRSQDLRASMHRCAELLLAHVDGIASGIWVHVPISDRLVMQSLAVNLANRSQVERWMKTLEGRLEKVANSSTPCLAEEVSEDLDRPQASDDDDPENGLWLTAIPMALEGRSIGVNSLLSNRQLASETIESLDQLRERLPGASIV